MMKLRWLYNCIVLTGLVLLMTGCAAAASTANIVLLEDAFSSVPVETGIPVMSGQAGAFAASADMPLEVVVASPTPIPTETLYVTPNSDLVVDEPAQTLEVTPDPTNTPTPKQATPTPKQTAKPTDTPAYKVVELDEYIDGYVNASTINLRKGPGTGYDVLGEYERYDELLITGTCEEWYRVKLDGLRGYMLMEYVTIGSVPAPTPSATPKPITVDTPPPIVLQTPTPTSTSSGQVPVSDELYLTAQVVYKEGDAKSYVAVANVIYNRLHSRSFPSNLYDVLYQKSQFSTSNLKTPSSAALAAVQQIFVDGNLILPAEVMYFHAASRGTTRSGYIYYDTFGGNIFFYK